ncbi:MAG: hypothetical protein ABI639_08555 [Thermoanaerobaculia bacterium]
MPPELISQDEGFEELVDDERIWSEELRRDRAPFGQGFDLATAIEEARAERDFVAGFLSFRRMTSTPDRSDLQSMSARTHMPIL